MFGQSSQNANKSVCQFYQRGNCKYGNNCFNLHPGASAGASTSNVFGRSTSSSGLGFTSYDKNNALQDAQFVEFVKQIIAEMKMWETNGLWQLSCLAPLKDHPPINEFVDTSPEELRVEAYESLKTGNMSTYQTSFNSKFEYQKQLRQSLKNRLPEALEVLKNVYYKTDSNGSTSSSSSTNLFGKPSGSFAGNSTAQSSIFGGANAGNKAPSMFGGAPNLGANNIFGAKPPASTFGGGSVFGSSALGGANTFKSTFGNNQSTLFGGSANKEPSQNIFGTQQNQGFGGTPSTGSTNIFGTSTNTSGSSSFFGTNTNTSNSNSIFGSNTSTTSSNPLFGTNTNTSSSNSLFGTSSATGTNNLFGSNQSSTGSNSLFGSNANNNGTNSLFGNNTNTSVSNNLFGTNNNNTSGSVNIFGSNTSASGTNNQFGTNANTSGSNSFFGSNPSSGSTSMFGTNTHTTGSTNVFGTSNTNSNNVPNQNSSIAFGNGGSQQEFGTAPAFGSQNIFNNNQGSTNVFSGGTNQIAQSSPFGIAPETNDNQGNVFGGGSMTSQNVFGVGNVDRVANHGETFGNNFGTNEQNQVGTTAAPTATSSIFGGNSENKPNMFGASTTNSIFSANIGQNANNIFSGSTNSNNSNSASLFGKPPEPADAGKPQMNTNLFQSNTQNVSASENINDQIYTPMHLLSIEDKNEFERDTFLRIPLIPPPKELCF